MKQGKFTLILRGQGERVPPVAVQKDNPSAIVFILCVLMTKYGIRLIGFNPVGACYRPYQKIPGIKKEAANRNEDKKNA